MATVVSIVLIIAALFMIVTVLLQSSEEGGISAISGQSSNSYFSKSKAKLMQEMYELGEKRGIEPKRLRFKINGIEE